MISPRPSDSLTQKGLKLSHLRLLAALADTGQISQAAALLSITQPAASRLLSEVERIVGAPVHCRTGRGMTLTPIGQALALRAQRVQTELRDAARDIAEVTAGEIGHVRIGSVTGPAIDRVLPVLRAAGIAAPLIDSTATTHAPRITAEITVAPRTSCASNFWPANSTSPSVAYPRAQAARCCKSPQLQANPSAFWRGATTRWPIANPPPPS